ncbi:MAG TPA: hypothetical protein VI758_02845 [Bacteroidota bacterium]
MSVPKKSVSSSASAEQQLSSFIAKFKPGRQKLIQSVRNALRKRFPTANELVYDYRKNFVIGYSPIESGSDAIVALTADADGVRLIFNHGPDLPDPRKILLGNAGQTRFIWLESARDMLRPEVEALMTAAVRKARIPLRKSGRGEVIIKSMSWKQRPRKPTVKR